MSICKKSPPFLKKPSQNTNKNTILKKRKFLEDEERPNDNLLCDTTASSKEENDLNEIFFMFSKFVSEINQRKYISP